MSVGCEIITLTKCHLKTKTEVSRKCHESCILKFAYDVLDFSSTYHRVSVLPNFMEELEMYALNLKREESVLSFDHTGCYDVKEGKKIMQL